MEQSLGSTSEQFAALADLESASHADVGQTSEAQLSEYLTSMVRIRAAEELIGDLVASGEAVCPCHLAIGQEAIPVAVASVLQEGDAIFGAHRSHGHYLALGGDVMRLLAEVLGRASGCSGGFGGSMHLRDRAIGLMGTVPIVGATIPIGLGAALAMKRDASSNVAVAYFGDGATEEGVFHESLNFAAITGAPVVFVCEQNFFSSHLHINERQPFQSVARYGEAHGVDALVVDGNDVLGMVESIGRAVEDVRKKSRPTFIEAVTYRWRGHVGHREDMDVGVARSTDLVKWKLRDPILRLVRVTHAAGIRLSWEDAVKAVRVELESALEEARLGDWPQESALWNTVLPSTFVKE